MLLVPAVRVEREQRWEENLRGGLAKILRGGGRGAGFYFKVGPSPEAVFWGGGVNPVSRKGENWVEQEKDGGNV